MKHNAWLIINPKSGGGEALKNKKIIVDTAEGLGWKGKYCEITAQKNGEFWVREAVKVHCKDIIVCGGDGTIREILKIVTKEKLNLGIIPIGTGNILAKNLNIPQEIHFLKCGAKHSCRMFKFFVFFFIAVNKNF